MKTADNVEVDFGDSVTLNCEIDGHPSPALFWLREGSNFVLSSQNNLRLNNIQEEDIGAYECRGTVATFNNAVHTTYVLKKGTSHDLSGADYSSFKVPLSINLSI